MLRTRITEKLNITHPIIQAPMNSIAGTQLVTAVSRAGGLGLLGGGYGDLDWLEPELKSTAETGIHPWGVGFITWSISLAILERALVYDPDILMFSFGDPSEFIQTAKSRDKFIICQVQFPDQARSAVSAGADVIVAQGTEAGGHGATRSLFPLLPAILDAVPDTPVVAAGGIVDGRGLAAALAMGADGVLLGTRFYASEECAAPASVKHALLSATADQTARSSVFDLIRGLDWPAPLNGRVLRNRFYERWNDRPSELAQVRESIFSEYLAHVAIGNADEVMIGAGEGVDLITEIDSAGRIIERIVKDAENALRNARNLVYDPD